MSRWSRAVCVSLLLTALFIGYSNHFQNQFHFDDWHTVQENLYIQNIRNIPRFFKDATTFSVLPSHQNYRPVVSATLAIDYRLAGGLNPAWFHIDTFIWYVALLVALYFMYFHLMEAAQPDPRNEYFSFFAVALFGLHPVCAETVNYIVQRGEVQSTLGVAAGMALYICSPRTRKWGLYLAPVIIGTLAKPPALMFTPILAVYVYLFESVHSKAGARGGDRIRYTFRASALALGVSVGLILLQIAMTPKTWEGGAESRYEYWLTQPSVVLHYIKSFFIPTELTADTDRDVVTSLLGETSVISLAFLVLIALSIRPVLKRPEMRPAAFGVMWFALALLPTSIQPLAEVDNDHRMFFPFVGLTLAVCWLTLVPFRRFVDSRRSALARTWSIAATFAAIFILSACVWGTRKRNEVWHTDKSLWKDVTEKSPYNGRGLMNYGLVLMDEGDYKGALEYYSDAENYTPNYSTLKINEAIAYSGLGEDVKAESKFREALNLSPKDFQSYFFFGQWLEGKKRLPEAIAMLRRAVEMSPNDQDSRDLLMQIYSEQGDTATLSAFAKETLRLFPTDTAAAGYLTHY